MIDRVPRTAGVEELRPIADELSMLADEILNLLETHINSTELSGNESQFERHIQNSNPETPLELEPDFQKVGGRDRA
jgi:replication initiation protein RepC